MAVTRYRNRDAIGNPWQELDELTNRLGRVFNDRLLRTGDAGTSGTWLPPMNVEETRDEIILTAELPGMSHENVELEVENNILTISGEKEIIRQEGEEERRYHLWERRHGRFERSFTLPRSANVEEISANFRNGILEVHMPKVPEAKGRKVQIRAETEA